MCWKRSKQAADIELNGWEKLGSEWELAKKPGSVFSIWREDGEQKEH